MKWGFFLSAFLLTTYAFADDKAAQALYDQAKASFDACADIACADQVVAKLQSALPQAQDTDLQFDILVLTSRALDWKGGRTDGDDNKKPIFEMGQKYAEQAKALNSDYADGYYWSGLSLALWAQANGVLSSLFKKNDLIKAMENALERVAHDGQAGEMIDGCGADRVLGRMYFKLPGFAGGDHDKSLKYLRSAVKSCANYAVNINFLAETLADGNSAEKTEARKILDDLLAQDPNTFNKSRIPDTIREFEDARKLRQQLGNG